ncbi:hypothetical protein [Paenibacillus antarcticus]|uniref:Right handed beta helix domain-containing protein n=1 Tax=Paenibacillus antarcticus TaxID=253703 RepID=A0A168PTP3_9BACL|nr:hypothetical protein [Paenibacillus antarcticus]OAB47067.1 hypothetical protein PBAT_08400 [Paenibacillus antarcticus]
MTTYYISNTGNDSNVGTSKDYPWATLSKIRQSGISFISGDSILLKRNDTFYGSLDLPGGILEDNRLLISSYGTGDKPKICGYKNLYISSSWTLHVSGVWKISLRDTSKFTGNIYTTDTNVGFLKVGGVIKGFKKSKLTSLINPWDFYCDATYLYVKATANPTTLNTDIRATVNKALHEKKNNTKIIGIEFIGSGSHGMAGASENTDIYDCDVHEIGGSYLEGYGDGTVRYGNGIECYTYSKNVVIENNRVYDCFDAAFTTQGPILQGKSGFEDIVIKNNVDWNNTQSFETWAEGSVVGIGFIRCKFEENICLNAGWGWGYDVRSDVYLGQNLLLYQITVPVVDITVKNNVFYNPKQSAYWGSNTFGGNFPTGYNLDGNQVFIEKGKLINGNTLGGTFKIENYSSFVTATGKDKTSSFYIIPNNTNQDIPTMFTSIINTLGLSNAKDNIIQLNLSAIKGSLEKVKASLLSSSTLAEQVIHTDRGIEILHAGSYAKAVGGYVSYYTDVIGTGYAKLFTTTITNGNSRMDLTMDYMLCGDSVNNRKTVGKVNLQVIPSPVLGTGTKVTLDVIEFLDFNLGFTRTDFVAVVEKETSSTVIVSLFFNVAKKDWIRLCYQPNLLFTTSPANEPYVFYNNQPLVTSLPKGTKILPSNDTMYVRKPTVGTTVPTSKPSYIGQQFINTTTKKVYIATGITAVTDWTAMN